MQLREQDKQYVEHKKVIFKDLPTNKKIEHIWEYYKWYFIAIFAAIFIVGYVAKEIMTPDPVYAVDMLISGAYEEPDNEETIIEKYNTQFDTQLTFSSGDWTTENDYTYMMRQKILALAATKQLDLMVISKSGYDKYAVQENKMLLPMEDIPELKEVLEKNQDKLLKAIDIEDGKEHIYGITLESLDSKLGIKTYEDHVVSVLESVKDMQAAVNVIKFLCE